LKGNKVLPRLPITRCRAQPRQFILRRAHHRERGRSGRGQLVQAAKRVEDAEMRRRIEQRLVLMLTMQLDQPRRQIFQRAGGRQRPVVERAAAPQRGDLAAHQQFFPAAFEDGLDRRRLLAGADEIS
jgi:hypothetical protein